MGPAGAPGLQVNTICVVWNLHCLTVKLNKPKHRDRSVCEVGVFCMLQRGHSFSATTSLVGCCCSTHKHKLRQYNMDKCCHAGSKVSGIEDQTIDQGGSGGPTPEKYQIKFRTLEIHFWKVQNQQLYGRYLWFCFIFCDENLLLFLLFHLLLTACGEEKIKKSQCWIFKWHFVKVKMVIVPKYMYENFRVNNI